MKGPRENTEYAAQEERVFTTKLALALLQWGQGGPWPPHFQSV